MKSFSHFLSEGISPGGLKKAAALITVYLKTNLNTKVFNFPEVEEFTGSNGSGYGIRFFIPDGNRSFRLNWSSPSSIGLIGVKSVDVWENGGKPLHAVFDETVSMAKTLPVLLSLLQGEISTGTHRTVPNDIPLHENVEVAILKNLNQLLESANEPSDVYDGVLDLIQASDFKKHNIWTTYKGTGIRIFDELCRRFPKRLVKEGQSFVWRGSKSDIAQMTKIKDQLLDDIGAVVVSVSRGSELEKYKNEEKAAAELEPKIEKLSYEKQLHDLEHLTRLTINGASNALFIAGRGGIGKTHTVEKILASLGLKDNDGYFKNTGSASAAGIYSLLFKHRDGIILFDDSDDALKDQESRNVFKAATDTKKVRKLVWNKMGKNIVEPDDLSPEEILDQGLLPRYFEFTGKIIFISNLSMDKLDPDGAIRTRAYLIDIDPTDDEIYDFMEKIVDDIPLQEGLKLGSDERKKVVKLMRTGKSKQSANLRKLGRALNMAAAGIDVSDDELKRMIEYYS